MKIPLSSLTFTLACFSSIHAEESKAPVLKLEQGWDDIESVDYSHLFIKLPNIKDEDNGMPALAKLENELTEQHQYHELFSNEKELSEDQLFLAKKKVFEAIQPRYKEIDAAIAKPHLYEQSGFSVISSSPSTIKMISLSRYLQLRTLMHVKAGNKTDALKSYRQEIKFADKLRVHCNHLVDVLVCNAVENTSLESADALLDICHDDPISRAEVIKYIRREIPLQSCMKRAFQAEFLMGFEIVQNLSQGNASFYDVDKEERMKLNSITFWDAVCKPNERSSFLYRKNLAGRHAAGLLMQPNKTIKFFHDGFLRQSKMLTLKPYELINYKDSKEQLEQLKSMKMDLFVKPNSNIMGQAMLAIASPIIDGQIIRMYVNPVASELIILRDALRRYKNDHGEFPDSLEALTPKYINEIPVDLFSKQKETLQYDKKKALIWSVGIDGVDSFNIRKIYHERQTSIIGATRNEQPQLSLK